MKYQFTVLIEKDEDGFYVAEVPELRSCYTQAKSLEELFKRIKEVIELCVEEQGLPSIQKQFIGLHQLELEL
ncbi:MAG: type II toxin-antitoxin system HicB family antitoxin [Candidatus Desulfofervidaceae bacterium]|nr:type II toxin-antitoxin system HicB family antitoxin [Candidatus Desulfofervidaceae bacterium]